MTRAQELHVLAWKAFECKGLVSISIIIFNCKMFYLKTNEFNKQIKKGHNIYKKIEDNEDREFDKNIYKRMFR